MISPLKKQHSILGSLNKNSPLVVNHYLPLFSNKSHKKQQNSNQKHKKVNNSTNNLSSSRLSKQSLKSTQIESNQFHIKLPNAFYNDYKISFYLDRSKTLSEKSMCYQVRPLSLTQRNKLQSEKLEAIVKRRHTQIENDQNLQASFHKNNTSTLLLPSQKRSKSSINLQSLPSSRTQYHDNNSRFQKPTKQTKIFSQTQRLSLSCKDKFKNYTSSKYNKLIHGSKLKEISQKILQKDINKILSQKVIKNKWNPPFQATNTLRQKFFGKSIVSTSTLKDKQQLLHNSSKTELKVLNIDRMFRKKEGKLTNVVPLPFPKFAQVNTKKNINLITNKKNKDKIHDIIEEFNTLLRISKLTKARTTKNLGIKGKNFTKNPTFEELMGLKLRPKTNVYPQQSEQIPSEIFLQHSQTYKHVIDKSFELRSNFIDGIKQSSHTFNLSVLTRFYSIFVNKIASIEDKVTFFAYFLVPSGKQLIFKSELIEILGLLCKGQNLPSINVNVKAKTLTEEEKARIFLQALIKVLFGQVSQDQVMNREMLSKILRENEEAVDLLLKLIQKRQ